MAANKGRPNHDNISPRKCLMLMSAVKVDDLDGMVALLALEVEGGIRPGQVQSSVLEGCVRSATGLCRGGTRSISVVHPRSTDSLMDHLVSRQVDGRRLVLTVPAPLLAMRW